ncbi:MAG: hypothetical protein ACO1TE_14200 [Prosthecobacter sp.]
MKMADLQRYRGSSISLSVDGTEALGMLWFSETDEPYIATLCFVNSHKKCPSFKHQLTPEEVATIRKKDGTHLSSRIEVTTACQEEKS